jgi:polyisoprenoid-binding protein YceI
MDATQFVILASDCQREFTKERRALDLVNKDTSMRLVSWGVQSAAMKKVAVLPVVFVAGLSAAPSADTRASYVVDAQRSKIEIQVAREGFFKAFAHDHLVSATKFSGEVQLSQSNVQDSAVSFVVDARSLVVLDPGESEKDRKEVQATMLGEQVLDVARYPQIEFASSSVKSASKKGDAFELQVQGALILHGVKRPVTIPIRVQVATDGTLTADAEVSLLQSEYGITPIKVAGGTVRVKDKLRLIFHILARKNSA